MPAPNTQQMPAIPVPPSIWWRPGSPSSFATGNQETPNWRAYFFWCRQRVCGSFLSWIDLLHAWVCTLHGLWPAMSAAVWRQAAPMRPGGECLASQHLSNHPRSNPASHRDERIVGILRGVPGWASRSTGARRKGGSAPVCGRLAALFAVFFFCPSVSSPNDKRLVTHLRRISGRGHGGERGRKMTARPGVGRVSAPAVRGLHAGPGRPGGAMGIGHQGLSSRCSSSPRWRCVEM